MIEITGCENHSKQEEWIFFFGILCLWILFEKELSTSTPPFEKAAFWKEYEIPYSNWQSIEILHNYKVDQKLPLLAQRLLEANT